MNFSSKMSQHMRISGWGWGWEIMKLCIIPVLRTLSPTPQYLQHVHEHSYAPDVALLAVAQVIYDFRSWKSWWIAWSLMGTFWKDFFPFTHILHAMHTKIFLDLYTMIIIFLRLVKWIWCYLQKGESGRKDLPAGSISVAQVGWLGGWMDR